MMRQAGGGATILQHQQLIHLNQITPDLAQLTIPQQLPQLIRMTKTPHSWQKQMSKSWLF